MTIWTNWDTLQDALGPDPSQPYMLTPESGLAETASVDHFEAIELPPISELASTGQGSDFASEDAQPSIAPARAT